MDTANLFTFYEQEENRFTNGLIALLKTAHKGNDNLLSNFFKKFIGIDASQNINFKVLKDIAGSADSEISNKEIIVYIETKRVSSYYQLFNKDGTFKIESLIQLKRHIKSLNKNLQKKKYLIYLSPDNPESIYIKTIKSKVKSLIHISWIEVYQYLSYYKTNSPILKSLIEDYADLIRRDILDKDFVAAFIKFMPGPLDYYDSPQDFFN